LTLSMVDDLALLSLRRFSFCCTSSFLFRSRLAPATYEQRRQYKGIYLGVPLALRELKAQAVQHQLMLVIENTFSARFFRSKPLKFFQGIERHVLVYGPDDNATLFRSLSLRHQHEAKSTHAN